MMASQVEALREEISAVLPNAQAGDEVLLRLEAWRCRARLRACCEPTQPNQRSGRDTSHRRGQSSC